MAKKPQRNWIWRQGKWPPAAKRYLELYRRHGAGMKRTAFEDEQKLAPSAYSNYRYKAEGWKEAFDAVQAEHASAVRGENPSPIRPREPKHPNAGDRGLWGWKAVFIREWERTGKRLMALQEAGITWKMVEDALEKDKHFKAIYKEIYRLITIELEDALIEAGRVGKVAAIGKVLEKMDPRWQPKVKHEHNISGRVIFTPETQRMAAASWQHLIEDAEIVEERPELPAAEKSH